MKNKHLTSKYRVNSRASAFTLIELLMVIAIIGVLASILIPTVGAVRKQANITASKSMLNQYVNAIQMYKGEYGYYPIQLASFENTESFVIDLSKKSEEFIKTMTGRNPDGSVIDDPVELKKIGNRKGISFLSLSESNFFWDNDKEEYDLDQLADRESNPNIFIVVDKTGNGFVVPGGPEKAQEKSKKIRSAVTAYVDGDLDNLEEKLPTYALFDISVK